LFLCEHINLTSLDMKVVFLLARYLPLVTGNTYFSETFDEGWHKRWIFSRWKEEDGKMGRWSLHGGKYNHDRGLVTTENEKHYTVSAHFMPFTNEGEELYIQYEVTLFQKDLLCGGAYMKIGPTMEDPRTFGGETPFNIMFGPDRCHSLGRTHVVFQYEGKSVPKKYDIGWKQDPQFRNTLYRLAIFPNNTARVDIDMEKRYIGDMRNDWEIIEPKRIPDPDDEMPLDWHVEPMIDDPTDKQPEKWTDERRIEDMDAKPPVDWDEDVDGRWLRPHKDNPEWRGPWHIRRIHNPEYKGFWEPKLIPNPEYVPNDKVYMWENFGYVGFDLWQVFSGTMFDNIVITSNRTVADQWAEKWKKNKALEQKAIDDEKARAKQLEEHGDDDDVYEEGDHLTDKISSDL